MGRMWVLCLLTAIRELKQRRFWTTHANRKWTFYIPEQWFCQNFQLNRLYRSTGVKKLSDTNFIASRHIKRKKFSRPVDVRRSKKHLCSSSLLLPGETRWRTSWVVFGRRDTWPVPPCAELDEEGLDSWSFTLPCESLTSAKVEKIANESKQYSTPPRQAQSLTWIVPLRYG